MSYLPKRMDAEEHIDMSQRIHIAMFLACSDPEKIWKTYGVNSKISKKLNKLERAFEEFRNELDILWVDERHFESAGGYPYFNKAHSEYSPELVEYINKFREQDSRDAVRRK